jgi:uncharacterized protein
MPTIERQFEPVPFTDVTFEDAFWKPRIEANRAVTIPHIYRKCEETGRIGAFDLNFERAVPSPVFQIFQDSDIGKWIQAAAYSLATHPDPQLELQLDNLIDKIVSAQQADGYLNTHFIVAQPEMRFRNLRDWHELYCAGHLVEAAVAYFQATGKRKFLDAMCRYIDLIADTFGPAAGQKRGYCGHPEIELALISLYHATDNPRYLELAAYFVDERGNQPNYFDQEAQERGEDPAAFEFKTYEYCQAHTPLRQQDKVVGHAVRAMYLLGAAADLSAEKNDPSLWQTCLRLWDNLITRRLYLTGTIGPAKQNEGFTEDYDLPDETAYAESCATVGLIQWNHRMLQIAGESKYADEIERGLYNGFLGGVALEGGRFFYENPLASTGHHHRQAWFDCPCCSSNIARTLASLGKYFYSSGKHDIWVHLYAQGTAQMDLADGHVTLHQVTSYPWDGEVKIEVVVPRPQEFTLHLRVPGWCSQWSLRLNGAAVNATPWKNGYMTVERTWQTGDLLEFVMEMPVQTVWPHPAVRYLQGRLALQRGPVVYCLEGIDHHSIVLDRISIRPGLVRSGLFRPVHQQFLLGGVTVIRGKGRLVSDSGWEGLLYRDQAPAAEEVDISAIPYYAWDNREPGEMRIWMRAELSD